MRNRFIANPFNVQKHCNRINSLGWGDIILVFIMTIACLVTTLVMSGSPATFLAA